MEFIPFVILLAITAVINAELKNYNGYKLFKVVPESKEDVNILMDIKNNGVGEFWSEDFGPQHDVRIMVSPDNEEFFQNLLKDGKLEAKLIFEDLQHAINNQNPPQRTRHARSTSNFYSLSWDRYYRLEEIHAWLDELADAYPNVVTTVVMGHSVEGREIKGIKIDYHPEREGRKAGVLEGNLHAREWISPATITGIIKEFLTSNNRDVRALAEDVEWHIFPVVNPDGYVYTFTNNRMWRKNRSKANSTTCANADDDMSNGVDLNRNFDFVWNTVGASSDPCSNTFAGPSPSSEPETTAISQYMLRLSDRTEILYYIAFHSYTQLIVIPYSHVSSSEVLTANNYADMFEIAAKSAEKLSQLYGTTYRVGASVDVMYPMSGTSFDWVKHNTNAKVAYLIELRDLGEHGFLLPASQIIPNNLEIMESLVEMDKTTRRLGYYSGASGIVFSLSVVILGLWTILMF